MSGEAAVEEEEEGARLDPWASIGVPRAASSGILSIIFEDGNRNDEVEFLENANEDWRSSVGERRLPELFVRGLNNAGEFCISEDENIGEEMDISLWRGDNGNRSPTGVPRFAKREDPW
jgi:hypothetical protein